LQRSGQSAAMMAGGPCAPIESSEGRLLDLESIHQGNDIDGDPPIAGHCGSFSFDRKARRAIAAQIRDDHPITRRRQQRRDIDKAVDVVRPAVQKK